MWDDIGNCALVAVVLVDTRRVDMCFPAIDYFEAKSVPFVVGVNNFDGAPRFDLDEVREALGVGAAVPVVDCDARNRASVKSSLLTLLESLDRQSVVLGNSVSVLVDLGCRRLLKKKIPQN